MSEQETSTEQAANEQAVKEQAVKEQAAKEQAMNRRVWFKRLGWAGVTGMVGVWTVSMLRFTFPRVLFEPSLQFDAGKPEDYTPGTVDTRFISSQRTWIVRNEDGSFYALSGICTHLGCTPRWLEADSKFKCPCHGSGFRPTGINFEGPAPRALDRYDISLSESGNLLVDKSVIYVYEKGGWSKSTLEV